MLGHSGNAEHSSASKEKTGTVPDFETAPYGRQDHKGRLRSRFKPDDHSRCRATMRSADLAPRATTGPIMPSPASSMRHVAGSGTAGDV